ncbi:MAG: glycosyltransferase family protein [Planctomycetota bacterium]|nr:MAG: glycosyltransferase family protein [Planctomycetota bacterium]
MGKTVGIVQARIGSTRLPGKVLLPLGDRCVLQWVLDRLARAERLDQIVVATSLKADDDAIAECCDRWGIGCFRGSENDLLDRFVSTARAFDADLVVRVNADNPLVDPHYVDELVSDTLQSGADYESFQLGTGRHVMLTALSFFAETATRQCLERADEVIIDQFEREHVTLGIYKRSSMFKVRFLSVPSFCNKPYVRFTLDTQADLELLREVFATLGDKAESAEALNVMQLLEEHPQWRNIMIEQSSLNPKSSKK